MSNFDPSSVNNLVGLWDFRSGAATDDTGLDDGIAQDGVFVGDASAAGDSANFDGKDDWFSVGGDDDPFDMDAGTIEVQFNQDEQVGSSPDVLVSRGEENDKDTEGYFHIAVTKDNQIEIIHYANGEYVEFTTDKDIFAKGDLVNVKYSWDEATGITLTVENLTEGTTTTVNNTTTGLTMDIGDNDGQSFTIGARESDDDKYDKEFDGQIDYVAIYESAAAAPDGAVDGEATGEIMELGYDDANAPTDQGGDVITNDADLIYGNGGDDTIDGAGGDDTIYGDGGTDPVTSTHEIFQWDEAPGFGNGNTASGFTQDTGNANITFSITSSSPGTDSNYETTTQNTEDLDAAVDENASFESVLDDKNDSATYQWESDVPLENVEFRVNDIDGDGVVQILAYDEAGNQIPVTLSDAGSGLVLSDEDSIAGNDTATRAAADDDDDDGDYTDDDNPIHSVLVTIPGPVSKFVLVHEQDGDLDSGINVTDITYDVVGTDFGDPGDDVIAGGDGDDLIYGEMGDDSIDGDDGDDSLDGGDGDDTIDGGDGSDTVDGGDGDNVIDTSGGSPLPDLGFPSYGPFPAVPADSDPNDDRDLVTTGSGNDSITTGDDADTISSGEGDDTINSGIDDDVVDAGSGDDLITSGEGNDYVEGGDGDDTIFGGLGPSVPQSINIPDAPDGGAFGPDPEPDNGKDTIFGGKGDDVVFGEDDDDLIYGGAGDDSLDGGIDDDTIFGEAGQDEITGGQGADSLSGGDDRDEFLIADREDAYGDTVDGGTGGDDVDTLDLTGLGRFDVVGETVDADGDSTSGTINFLDANDNIEGSMVFREIENLVICFTPGTRIATPRGEVEVQNLRAGDRVITRDDGVQEINWIGKRKLSANELIQDPKLRPILIRKGSLGNGLPERDMMVSPNHRMLMANSQTQVLFDEREVLVAAKHLVGQAGVHQIDTLGTEYIHLMFERHEVILGDGTWTESFQPGEYSLSGIDSEQRDELFKLFPSLRKAEGLRSYGAARQSLKAHEAKMLRQSMGSQ